MFDRNNAKQVVKLFTSEISFNMKVTADNNTYSCQFYGEKGNRKPVNYGSSQNRLSYVGFINIKFLAIITLSKTFPAQKLDLMSTSFSGP